MTTGNRFYEAEHWRAGGRTSRSHWRIHRHPDGNTAGSSARMQWQSCRIGEADFDGDDKYYIDPDGNSQWRNLPGIDVTCLKILPCG